MSLALNMSTLCESGSERLSPEQAYGPTRKWGTSNAASRYFNAYGSVQLRSQLLRPGLRAIGTFCGVPVRCAHSMLLPRSALTLHYAA